jgi:Tol biopolymer transport system component/DNA-binding winged helix-turn-helix (wHTH) protein
MSQKTPQKNLKNSEASPDQAVLSVDGFEIDFERRRLVRNGEPIKLFSKAFDVLAYLAARPGETVSKRELLDAVWPDSFVEEANLSVQISAIRKALSETSSEPNILITVPGKGYQFAGNGSRSSNTIVIERRRSNVVQIDEVIVEDDAESNIHADHANPNYEALSPRSTWRMFAYVAPGLLMIAVLVGFTYFKGSFFARSPVVPFEKVKITRLTSNGIVGIPIISPDGNFFAYSVTKPGSVTTEVRLSQIGSATEITIVPYSDVAYYPRAFSTDGKWVYYTAAKYRQNEVELFRVRTLGGPSEKISENVDRYLKLSPDRSKIAYVLNDEANGSSTLAIANIDGSNEQIVARRPFELRFNSGDCVAWSPDGSELLAGAFSDSSANWEGRSPFEVHRIQISTGSIRQLTNEGWRSMSRIVWLAQGDSALIEALDKDRVKGGQIWSVDVDSGRSDRISRDLEISAGSLSASADGKRIVTVKYRVSTTVWTVDLSKPFQTTQLTFGTDSHYDGWNGLTTMPDGRIAYTTEVDNGSSIWIMKADGSDQKMITGGGYRDERPAIGPDGHTIYFQSNRSGETEIWAVKDDGTGLKQITKVGGASTPSPSSDGQWIVLRRLMDKSKTTQTVWKMSLRDGELVKISDTDSSPPTVSPDGKMAAYSVRESGVYYLVVDSIETGKRIAKLEAPITANFRYWVRWTRDGGAISYPDVANGIWIQQLAGGEPKPIQGVPGERTYSHDWSVDGRSIVFGRASESRDAILIEDVTN